MAAFDDPHYEADRLLSAPNPPVGSAAPIRASYTTASNGPRLISKAAASSKT